MSHFLAAFELNTTIFSSPSDDIYSAATYLSLECRVSDGIEGYSYQWSSDCTGDCFVASQNTSFISRSALHSTDSGNHTCLVVDSVGNMGSETILINVVGKYNIFLMFSTHVCSKFLLPVQGLDSLYLV